VKSDHPSIKVEPVVISDDDDATGAHIDTKIPQAIPSICNLSGVASSVSNVPRLAYHPRPMAVSFVLPSCLSIL
jgi:hypothetical protein